jgi:hypothetical protein
MSQPPPCLNTGKNRLSASVRTPLLTLWGESCASLIFIVVDMTDHFKPFAFFINPKLDFHQSGI